MTPACPQTLRIFAHIVQPEDSHFRSVVYLINEAVAG